MCYFLLFIIMNLWRKPKPLTPCQTQSFLSEGCRQIKNRKEYTLLRLYHRSISNGLPDRKNNKRFCFIQQQPWILGHQFNVSFTNKKSRPLCLNTKDGQGISRTTKGLRKYNYLFNIFGYLIIFKERRKKLIEVSSYQKTKLTLKRWRHKQLSVERLLLQHICIWQSLV